MSCDLLPEWLNLFLDDVETTLCLPILLVMVLCTIQFIVNHAVDIGTTFYQTVIQKSGEEDDEAEEGEKEKGEGFMDKIKGIICNLMSHNTNTDSKPENNLVIPKRKPNRREEEWDYCEEDDDL
ncbi:uncharacterized protein LOC143188791 [Calliopsis andreniformis]|uniref:uncharacterized protein LOC143188791 n=1 Tax=Calliopsis andreniformis TaxID=337506 RepID=UPI003FCDD44F